MSVTVREVAKQAGVSVTTVSRVLNNHSSVSARTMRKVKAAIEELQYTPNLSAASLRRNHHQVLATGGQHATSLETPRKLPLRLGDTSGVGYQLRSLKKENDELKRLIRRLSKELNSWMSPTERF